MIDFDTENLVIVCYPRNAGGKFLINSLGLSDDAVFQYDKFVVQQLNGEFTPDDKFDYLVNAISQKTVWNDLDLGCTQLFGINSHEYMFYPPEVIKQARFYPIISTLSKTNKKFFIIAHHTRLLDQFLMVWPNAQVIIFKNCQNFISHRTKNPFIDNWNLIKGADWPTTPSNLIEYNQLSDAIKFEVEQIFNLQIKEHFIWQSAILDYYEKNILQYNNRAIYVDNNMYFSQEETINQIRELYSVLGLSGFNKTNISKYYNMWINKLLELK